MSFIDKKIDHNKLSNYQSLDRYVGTYDFYKDKYGEKFDTETLEIFEILARVDKDNQEELIEDVKRRQEMKGQLMLQEFLEIKAEPNEIEIKLSNCTIKEE